MTWIDRSDLVRPRHHITIIRSIIFVTAAKILSKWSYTEVFTCSSSYHKFTKLLFFIGTTKHFSRDCSLKSLCAVFLGSDVLSDVLCVHWQIFGVACYSQSSKYNLRSALRFPGNNSLYLYQDRTGKQNSGAKICSVALWLNMTYFPLYMTDCW